MNASTGCTEKFVSAFSREIVGIMGLGVERFSGSENTRIEASASEKSFNVEIERYGVLRTSAGKLAISKVMRMTAHLGRQRQSLVLLSLLPSVVAFFCECSAVADESSGLTWEPKPMHAFLFALPFPPNDLT